MELCTELSSNTLVKWDTETPEPPAFRREEPAMLESGLETCQRVVSCHQEITWSATDDSFFAVPFDFCERPPTISHGFMATQPENAYRILTEVEYECHPGFFMKAQSKLKCHSTGCWTPNELPQCIREDLYRKLLLPP